MAKAKPKAKPPVKERPKEQPKGEEVTFDSISDKKGPYFGMPFMSKNVLKFENAVFNFDEILGVAEEWADTHKYYLNAPKRQLREYAVGTQIIQKVTAYKEADRYCQYEIVMEWKIDHVEEVKVPGTDHKMQQGNIRLIYSVNLNLDHEHRWGRTKGATFLRHLYEKYIYERELLRHKVQLWTECNALYSTIKTAMTRYRTL